MRGRLQVYGASLRDAGSACLVMELVAGGNLHQRIYDRGLPRMAHLDILQARRTSKNACAPCVSLSSHACAPCVSLSAHACTLFLPVLAHAL